MFWVWIILAAIVGAVVGVLGVAMYISNKMNW